MPLILELIDGNVFHRHWLPIDVHRPWQLRDSLIAASSEHDEALIYDGEELVGRCYQGAPPLVKKNGQWIWD